MSSKGLVYIIIIALGLGFKCKHLNADICSLMSEREHTMIHTQWNSNGKISFLRCYTKDFIHAVQPIEENCESLGSYEERSTKKLSAFVEAQRAELGKSVAVAGAETGGEIAGSAAGGYLLHTLKGAKVGAKILEAELAGAVGTEVLEEGAEKGGEKVLEEGGGKALEEFGEKMGEHGIAEGTAHAAGSITERTAGSDEESDSEEAAGTLHEHEKNSEEIAPTKEDDKSSNENSETLEKVYRSKKFLKLYKDIAESNGSRAAKWSRGITAYVPLAGPTLSHGIDQYIGDKDLIYGSIKSELDLGKESEKGCSTHLPSGRKIYKDFDTRFVLVLDLIESFGSQSSDRSHKKERSLASDENSEQSAPKGATATEASAGMSLSGEHAPNPQESSMDSPAMSSSAPAMSSSPPMSSDE